LCSFALRLLLQAAEKTHSLSGASSSFAILVNLYLQLNLVNGDKLVNIGGEVCGIFGGCGL
jgi:hypothetical protein